MVEIPTTKLMSIQGIKIDATNPNRMTKIGRAHV